MPTERNRIRIGILGGGAAGFFAGLEIAKNPNIQVHILERTKNFLSKVKISGGGRCNVTHNQMDTDILSGSYPRGSKELRYAFRKFGPSELLDWFQDQNVLLKKESDGRIFPVSDSSETIIECFVNLAKKRNIKLDCQVTTLGIEAPADQPKGNKTSPELETFQENPKKIHHTHSTQLSRWGIRIKDSQDRESILEYDSVLVATGSSRQVWKWLEALGHRIVDPVPSLFTFRINHPLLEGLSGQSFPQAILQLPEFKTKTQGSLLITHWGLSGPPILRLSAFAARDLHGVSYNTKLFVNFVGLPLEKIKQELKNFKTLNPNKTLVHSPSLFPVSNRFWLRLLSILGISESKRWAEISANETENLTQSLFCFVFAIEGKGEFKDEFVTAGGVHRKDVNFETMESRIRPGLFLAGEVLDVDGITGGFNFQNAWTTGWIAAHAIQRKYSG